MCCRGGRSARHYDSDSHRQRCAVRHYHAGPSSKLSAWWFRLGILPKLIEPGRSTQNGWHERMHRTLKAETTRRGRRDVDGDLGRCNDDPDGHIQGPIST